MEEHHINEDLLEAFFKCYFEPINKKFKETNEYLQKLEEPERHQQKIIDQQFKQLFLKQIVLAFEESNELTTNIVDFILHTESSLIECIMQIPEDLDFDGNTVS